MVEIETGLLRGQCLNRRIGERDRLVSGMAAAAKRFRRPQYTDSRQKLARAYPDTAKESQSL
jgi:hypothetical protein